MIRPPKKELYRRPLGSKLMGSRVAGTADVGMLSTSDLEGLGLGYRV